MPITAQFIADFTSFKAAVDDAHLKLKSFATGASDVERALARVGNSFSGKAILQQATLATKAVEEIGGVTKLTEQEQKRLNATLTEAIAKYKALGETAPKAMTDLAEATKHAAEPTQTLSTRMIALGTSMGQGAWDLAIRGLAATRDAIIGAAEAIPNLVEQTVKLGASLYTQSQRTGISIESLSGLRYVGMQTSTDLTQLTGAIFKMEQNLGNTGKSGEKFRKWIQDVGLDLTKLRNDKPEEAFAAMMEKLGELPTQAERASQGTIAFGKTFKGMSNLAVENIRELIDEAHRLGAVWTTDMVSAAYAAETAMTRLRFQWEAAKTQIASAFLPAVIGVATDLSGAFASAVDKANAKLAAMGGQGGFLTQVVAAMGTGDKAIAAQIAVYDALRAAIVSVVRNGVEWFITGLGYALNVLEIAKQKYYEFALVIDAIAVSYRSAHLAHELFLYGVGLGDLDRVKTATKEWSAAVVDMAEHEAKATAASKSNWNDWAAGVNKGIESFATDLESHTTDIGKIIKDARDRVQKGLGGMSNDFSAAADSGEKLKGLAKSADDLRQKIEAAFLGMQPMAEITDAYGKQAYETALQLDYEGKAVDGVIRSMANLYRQTLLNKEAEKQLAEIRKLEQGPKTVGPIGDGGAALRADMEAQKLYWKTVEDLTKRGLAEQNAQRLHALQYKLALDKQSGASERVLFQDRERLAEEEVRIKRETEQRRFELEVAGLDQSLSNYQNYAAEHNAIDAGITAAATREAQIRAAEAGDKVGATFGTTVMAGFKGTLAKLPQIMEAAFTGGGGLLGAAKAIGVELADSILTPLMKGLAAAQQRTVTAASGIAAALGGSAGGGIGATVAGIASGLGGAALAASAWGTGMAAAGVAGTVALGAATLGIGAAAVGAVMLVQHFTSLSASVKAARKTTDEFADGLAKTLKQAQLLEVQQLVAAGNSAKWATQVVTIRDAYVKAGFSVDEAYDAVNRLWAAEQKGGAATKAIIDEIIKKMGDMGAAADKVQAEIDDMVESLDGSKIFHEADVAVQALARIGGAGKLTTSEMKQMHDTVQKAIDKYVAMGIEVPPALLAVADATKEVTAETEKLKKSQDEALDKLRLMYGFKFGGGSGGEGESETKNVSGIFAGMSAGEAELLWLADVGGSKSDHSDWERVKGQYGFRYGTGGRYIDFGADGTPVWLHGKERVMTEGEAAGGAAGNIVINVMLDGQVLTRSVMRNLPGTLSLYGLH